MSTFKFLHAKDIPSVLGGSVLFGSARYYRLMEVVFEDKWIGDKNEGVWRGFMGPISITPENRDESLVNRLEQLGIANVSKGGTFVGKRIDIIIECDDYIFSVSKGDLPDLARVMLNPSQPLGGYDGCVEIFDLEQFRNHLWNHGTINGRSIKDFATSLEQHNVVDGGSDS